MAVPPNYFITGAWKTNTGVITDVFLHLKTATGFNVGKKTAEAAAIQLLKANNTVMTLKWDYKTATWKRGAYVTVVKENNKEFLRSVNDTTGEDNLDNIDCCRNPSNI